MSKVKMIRELDDWRGRAILVRRNENQYYIVSSAHTSSGFETLVFPADADGDVTAWLEVAGGRGVSRAQAIAELEMEEG